MVPERGTVAAGTCPPRFWPQALAIPKSTPMSSPARSLRRETPRCCSRSWGCCCCGSRTRACRNCCSSCRRGSAATLPPFVAQSSRLSINARAPLHASANFTHVVHAQSTPALIALHPPYYNDRARPPTASVHTSYGICVRWKNAPCLAHLPAPLDPLPILIPTGFRTIAQGWHNPGYPQP